MSIRELLRLGAIVAVLLATSVPARAMSVTFINPGKQGEVFWDMVTRTMEAAARDLDIELEVIYAERNRVQMRTLGLAHIARHRPDYLVLVNEEQAAEELVAAADAAGIRTLLLLNSFTDEQRGRVGEPRGRLKHWLGSLTPDNASAGRRMMKALQHCARERGLPAPRHLLAIGGDRVTPASLDRNAGMLAELERQPDTVLDRFLYANWNQTDAREAAAQYLQWAQRNDIRPALIWAANDPIAAGAIDALEAAGLSATEDTCVVGLNWSHQGLTLLQQGKLQLTDGGHFLAGGWALVLLHDYDRGLDFYTPDNGGQLRFAMQSIERSNLTPFLEHFGDGDWDRIDYRRLLRTSADGAPYDFSLARLLRSLERPRRNGGAGRQASQP